MKKITAILGLMMMVALNLSAQGTPQEQDFISRFEAFQKAGDMSRLRTIWYFGNGIDDAGTIFLKSLDGSKLEEVILEGIKSIKFVEVYPALKDQVTNGLKIEGGSYIPNLEPYKLVMVEYQTPVKNGSTGFFLFTGMKDGKLMICGYKKIGK
jgi:hypothetical protein